MNCGCCGRYVETFFDDIWCRDCAVHVDRSLYSRRWWDATYFARTGKDCPFQVDDKRTGTVGFQRNGAP